MKVYVEMASGCVKISRTLAFSPNVKDLLCKTSLWNPSERYSFGLGLKTEAETSLDLFALKFFHRSLGSLPAVSSSSSVPFPLLHYGFSPVA